MTNELYEQAKESFSFSAEISNIIMESLEYSSISFLNQAVEILQIFRTRIERGDKIVNEADGTVFTLKSYKKFVQNTFSDYIYQHVFLKGNEVQKNYFELDSCEEGYSLILAPDGKQKTFEWISSLSERFSLVYMKATKIVYIKNMKTGNYSPFISEKGKYCRYDKEKGMLIEI